MGGFTQEAENMSSAGILKMTAEARDSPGQVSKTDHVPSSGHCRGNTVPYPAHPEGLSSSLAAPGQLRSALLPSKQGLETVRKPPRSSIPPALQGLMTMRSVWHLVPAG